MYSPAALISTGVILPLLGVVTVCLRYWVRLRFSPSYIGIDDILIVVGAVFVCGMGAIQIGSTIQGDNSPETKATPAKNYVQYKYNYAIVVIEKVAYGAIKLSVLFFYRRIFGVLHKFRLFNNILIGLTTVWALAFIFTNIFICGTHVDVQWKDRKNAHQYCGDVGTSDLWFAITDVVGDALIVSMPFFVIRKLQMTHREKWAVSVVFLLAFLSTIAGILRLAFISVAYHYGQMAWNQAPPPVPEPYVLRVVNAPFWTLVEVAFAVVAACLPPLGALIRCSPSPKRLISNVRRKMSYASGRTSISSQRKRTHPWDKEKGDSQATFVEGSYNHSARAWGKKSQDSGPTISDDDINLSSMGAEAMWNDAHHQHLSNAV